MPRRSTARCAAARTRMRSANASAATSAGVPPRWRRLDSRPLSPRTTAGAGRRGIGVPPPTGGSSGARQRRTRRARPRTGSDGSRSRGGERHLRHPTPQCSKTGDAAARSRRTPLPLAPVRGPISPTSRGLGRRPVVTRCATRAATAMPSRNGNAPSVEPVESNDEGGEPEARQARGWNLTPRRFLGSRCLEAPLTVRPGRGTPSRSAVPIRGGIVGDEGFPFFRVHGAPAAIRAAASCVRAGGRCLDRLPRTPLCWGPRPHAPAHPARGER